MAEMSVADIAAVTRNNNDNFMDGNGMWLWIVIILFFFCGNGWNRNNGLETNIDTRFLERDIFNTNQNVSNSACQTQRDVLENRYSNQLGVQSIISSQKDCCCATQKEILQSRYDNALQTNTLQSQMSNNALQSQMQLAQCCCDLKAEGLANTQKILDKMCENEINQLRTDLQSAQLQISQLSQTANITNALRPFPIPSYTVTSPYVGLYNPYNGCGCGCGNTVIA